MTIMCNDAPTTAHEPRVGVLGGVLGFLSLLDRGMAAADAYETLSHMSDSQLARRGLTRADIANAARDVLFDGKKTG